MKNSDTIVAQATSSGRAGIGIVRISGSKAKEVAKAVLGKVPLPRYADYLPFKNVDGSTIDQGIALWFPGPHSFTGEDVLELHAHGGQIVLELLLNRILMLTGLRIAKPGEFSERAFLNNKIDLIQAEAIADLINANSEQAARSAINSLQGRFSVRIARLVESLIHLRMHIEASIDFSEEKNDFFGCHKKIAVQLDHLTADLDAIHGEARQGSLLREGMKVVIAGCPNAGKSSLLNALAGREVAIVTDIAGTTRDALHDHILIDGMPLHIIDTAGLRETSNEIERIGVKRAWEEISRADYVLFVVDGTTTDTDDLPEIWPNFISRLPPNLPIIVVRNKADLTGEEVGISDINGYSLICLSALTGTGIEKLRAHLIRSMGLNISAENCFLARRRHLHALKMAEEHFQKCKALLNNASATELIAEELRLAQKNLDAITGEFTSDDLLGEIFSNFCIGK